MARSNTQTRNKNKTPESAATEAPTEINEEITVTDTAEAVEAETTETTETTEKPAEVEIDFTAFTAAARAAVDSRDTSTGTIPVEQIEATKVEYAALPSTKARNAGRKILQEWLKEAVGALDVVTGKAVMELSDALQAPQPKAEKVAREKKAKTPVDPAAAFRLRLTAAYLAYSLVSNDVPDGVDGDKVLVEVEEIVNTLAASADSYFAWLNGDKETRGDEPEVEPAVKAAAKMALGKAVRASSPRTATVTSGERGNTLNHISEVVGRHEAGTFLLIREIAQEQTAEYPQGGVSPGAISGRLFPAEGRALHASLAAICTPGENANGKKGLTVL